MAEDMRCCSLKYECTACAASRHGECGGCHGCGCVRSAQAAAASHTYPHLKWRMSR